jgi:hypothetical protein
MRHFCTWKSLWFEGDQLAKLNKEFSSMTKDKIRRISSNDMSDIIPRAKIEFENSSSKWKTDKELNRRKTNLDMKRIGFPKKKRKQNSFLESFLREENEERSFNESKIFSMFWSILCFDSFWSAEQFKSRSKCLLEFLGKSSSNRFMKRFVSSLSQFIKINNEPI